MIKSFKALNKSFKISILTIFITVISFAATAFLLTTRIDIPLGLLVGGIVISLLHLAQGFGEIHDNKSASTTATTIIIILKFVILVVLMLIYAFMFYKWNLPYLNVFCLVGIYTVAILITVLVYMLDKE